MIELALIALLVLSALGIVFAVYRLVIIGYELYLLEKDKEEKDE